MSSSQIKLFASLAVLVAALALAGSALAGARPDDRAGAGGAGATNASIQVRPDDRAGIRGVGSPRLAIPFAPTTARESAAPAQRITQPRSPRRARRMRPTALTGTLSAPARPSPSL